MTEARDGVVVDATPDLLNTLAGIEADSPLGELRAQRGEIARYIQGSYNALLEPAEGSGVSAIERGLIALRVAFLTGSEPLREHYRARLAELGASTGLVAEVESTTPGDPLASRMLVILQHVDLLTHAPHEATPAHLAKLQAQGLSTPDIVTISQLIAFLSFQVRTLAGLQLLAEVL
ncbi:MAG: CMD domain protein [Caldilineaceae bacterium]|nr:CMD domain protein [Caldilineaceae bacterium]